MVQQETYRQAASAMVFRPVPGREGAFQFLLLHKPRKRDAWQLPQGGAESGETSEQTAIRELKEEAGMADVRFLGRSAEVYQYDFPSSFRRFRPDNIRGQRIEYVFLLAPADAEVRVDDNEVDRFAWILPEQARGYVHRREYLALLRRLWEEGTRLLRA